MRIGVVSLGCDKNRVDTEHMMTLLSRHNYTFTGNTGEADIIAVNTCAFISSAREEAINTILEMSQFKNGNCKCLIVTGCLPQKYLSELKDELSEVDIWLGTNEYEKLPGMLAQFFKKAETHSESEYARHLTTPLHYAYLKIADGCDNFCTYCTIPSIRGKYISKPLDSILKEARNFADRGVKELILVAQDVTSYGKDLGQNINLVYLIKELSQLDCINIIRLLYCYPESINEELVTEIAVNPKVAKYIDIPLQHVDDDVLKLMNRRGNYDSIVKLIDKLRAACPQIKIRSTFMVGFPGESEEAFERLCNFISEYKVDYAGFFAYSKEDDTPSARLKNHVSKAVMKKRLNKVSLLQQAVAFSKADSMIGQTADVIYEDIDYKKNNFVGRLVSAAPDIDNKVYFSSAFCEAGNIYKVKITGRKGYDLIGKVE